MEFKLHEMSTTHPLEWLTLQRTTTPNTGEDAEHMELSPSSLVGMLNGTAILERIRQLLTKLSIHLPCSPALSLLSVYSKERKHVSTWRSTLLITAKNVSNPNVHRLMK